MTLNKYRNLSDIELDVIESEKTRVTVVTTYCSKRKTISRAPRCKASVKACFILRSIRLMSFNVI